MNLQKKTFTLVVLILLLSGVGAMYSYKFFHSSNKDDLARNEKKNLANDTAVAIKSMTAPIARDETKEGPAKEEQNKKFQQAQISLSAPSGPSINNTAARDAVYGNEEIIKSMSAR